MQNKFFIRLMSCAVIALGVVGCSKEIATESDFEQEQTKEVGFTMTAEYGTPETRAAFDEDGLGLSWEPGDKLYLCDVAGKNATVTLETSITEPSKSASFSCDKSVLSGEYVVLFGRSSLKESYTDITMTDLANLKSRIVMYGSLTVTDGQTSASISLKQAYAKLTFKFQNLPSLNSMQCGMAVTKDGQLNLYSSHKITANGVSENQAARVIRNYFGTNSGKGGAVLVLPTDLSGKTLYFFIYGTDASGNHITYEFVKNGINIQAGKNYNITLDCNAAASVSTIPSTLALSTPADFRAASYWNTNNSYKVAADIDFTDEVYMPMYCKSLDGEKHTLSNITIDYANVESIGITSSADTIKDLKVNNLSVKGGDSTGGLSGWSINISGCELSGIVSISGGNYTGGLCGDFRGSLFDSFVLKADVISTGSKVGGLFGSSRSISKCGFEGTVSATGSMVGGIVGNTQSEITECYVNGTVKSSSTASYVYVGGIVGYSYYPLVNNSYFIGETSGCGISGYNYNDYSFYMYNCYSYGTIGSYGISEKYVNSSKNLTSASSLASSSYNNRKYCNLGASNTFLANINVINSDEKYSTQCWPGIDAKCPLLQWQATGFGGDIDIPGFGDEDWK